VASTNVDEATSIPTLGAAVISTTAGDAVASQTSTPTPEAAQASQTSTPTPEAAQSTMSAGAKAGIAIASIAGAVFIILAALFFIRRRRQISSSKLVPEDTVMTGEAKIHAMQPKYGVVPVYDAAVIGYDAEKEKQMDLEPTAGTGLLSLYKSGHNYRDSTASTLMQPYSPGEDQRYSTASTNMLLPPRIASRSDNRQSTTSTLLSPSLLEEDKTYQP
jgi:hypothetical protein